MARLVSLIILTVLIVFLGITFFSVITPFLLPLFLAAVLAVLCQPVFRALELRLNGRTRLAAGLTTAGVLGLLLVPLSVGVVVAAIELVGFAQHALADRSVFIETGTDEVRELKIVPETVILLDGRPAKLNALARGDGVRAIVTGDDVLTARSVEAFRDRPDAARLDENGQGQSGVVVKRGSRARMAFDRIRDELDVEELVARVQPYVGTRIDPEQVQAGVEENVAAGLKVLAQRTLGIAGAAFGFLGVLVSGVIGLLMFVIALYYFLADGPSLLAATQELIPVHMDYQQQLLERFTKVVRAVVLATFMAALSQGLATALALQFFGFGHFFAFFAAATLTAMVPLAGTWVVWGPCAAWLAWQGDWVQAGVLTAIGAVGVGMLDNVVRTYVLNTDAKLHPLLAFVSVLGGLQVLGLWGVFVGPIVASCLHALVKIFNTELKEFSKERFARGEPALAGAGNVEPIVVNPAPVSQATSGGPENGAAAAPKAQSRAGRKRARRNR